MEISLTLNVHKDPSAVSFVTALIRKNVTENIVIVVDGKNWDRFEIPPELEKYCIKGFVHGANRSPYKNVALGFMETAKRFPDSDWYCYCEFDVLFLSDYFKHELNRLSKLGASLVGFDHKHKKYQKNDHWIVKEILEQDVECHKMLGCTMFYSGECIRQLMSRNFFQLLLDKTKDFQGADFPDFKDYAVEEIIFPSAASCYGEICTFSNPEEHPSTYLVRFRPKISQGEITKHTSIAHPVKDLSVLNVN